MANREIARPYIEIACATLIWSLTGPYVRWINLPALYLGFLRCVTPVILIGVWMAWRGRLPILFRLATRAGVWSRYTVVASACNVARTIFYFWGFSILPIGHAVLLMYTWPILVSILSIWWLRDPFRPWQLVMGLLALAGVGLIQFDPAASVVHTHDITVGSIVILGAALCNAIMLLALKKSHQTMVPSDMIVVQNLFGAVVLAPIGLSMITAVPVYKTLMSVGVSTAVGVLGFLMFFSALKRLPATQGALLSYLEVAFTVAIGVLFLNEPLTAVSWIGGILILTGSIGAQLAGRR